MKIVILGAGQVGRTVAFNLSNETNDITVVDNQAHLLKELQDQLDIRTVLGHASQPSVLASAGVDDADLILAVTNSDETNMMACQVAHTLYHTPIRLARVRSQDYLKHAELFAEDAIPVDVLISPEQLVTQYIHHIIAQPGVFQMLDFLHSKAQLVSLKADHTGAIVGHPIRDLEQHLPGIDTRIVAIYRNDEAQPVSPDSVIEEDDEIFFIGARQHIPKIIAAFRHHDKPNTRVMIAGGGNIGKSLAALLENRFRVKIIESDLARCRYLAEHLQSSIVLNGDAGDAQLLKSEDVEFTDVYCAVTNDDEANILSAMLAKRLGVKKTISIVNRPSYVDLAQGNAVDIAVSPAQVTIGALLAHIRRGDVIRVYALRLGSAEAIEIVAHGDRDTSKVVGRRIDELPLPKSARIGAIERNKQVLFPNHDSVIESGDHIVLFISDKHKVAAVERLFQVAVTFA